MHPQWHRNVQSAILAVSVLLLLTSLGIWAAQETSRTRPHAADTEVLAEQKQRFPSIPPQPTRIRLVDDLNKDGMVDVWDKAVRHDRGR